MIEIDGSIGEGGGQILRTAIAISTIIKEPIKIYNIRAKRKPPGIKLQHLIGIRTVAKLTNAEVEGAKIGSKTIIFEPKQIKINTLRANIATAGSISLILQAILPTLAFSPFKSKVEITGGTDVKWSPLIDYMRYVFLRQLKKMGYQIEIEIIRRGHYPKGGGMIRVYTTPVRKLTPIREIELGEIKKVKGISHCVKLPRHVSERQAQAAERLLKLRGYDKIEIEREWYRRDRDPHLGPGSGIVLWTETDTNAILGADELGERGKRAEIVGKNVAKRLIQEIERGAPIDKHLCDMLPIYIAIADGTSVIITSKIESHAETTIKLLEKILDVKFSIEPYSMNRMKISVKGMGLLNKEITSYGR